MRHLVSRFEGHASLRRPRSAWSWIVWLCLLLGTTMFCTSSLHAKESASVDDALKSQFQQWIRDLTSEDFETREAARTKLRTNASKLERAGLLDAAVKHEDAEVRRTIRSLKLRVAGHPTVEVVDDADEYDFTSIGNVTLTLDKAPISDALRMVGGRFYVPEALRGVTATADVRNVSYFTALDEVLRATKLDVAGPPTRAGMVSIRAMPPAIEGGTPIPSATTGPLRARVVSVSSTKSFGAPTLPLYALKLELDFAPSVSLRQFSPPRIVEAKDKQGNTFSSPIAKTRSSVMGVSQGTFRRTIDVSLRADHAKCGSTLASLELAFPLRLRHGKRVVTFNDFETLPAHKDASGARLTSKRGKRIELRSLESVSQGPRGSYTAEARAHLPSDVARQSASIAIQAADGRWHPMYVTGGRSVSADGMLHMPARVYRLGTGDPKAVAITWFEHEDQGTITLRFQDVPLR